MSSLDDAIEKYGGAERTYSVRPLPMPSKRTEEVIEEVWAITSSLTNCWREAVHVNSAWMLLDVQRSLPEFSITEQMKKCFAGGEPLRLPESIHYSPFFLRHSSRQVP